MARHPPQTAEAREYQAEDDVRILVRAKEIRKDSKRFGRAMVQVRKQMDILKTVKS